MKKQESNVSLKLGNLEDMGIIEESKKIGNAVIYKKLPELKNLKPNSKTSSISSRSEIGMQEKSIKQNSSNTVVPKTITDKMIEIGRKYGINNIDQKWIDSLIILNFIETACTKFLMDHEISETTVKSYKWEKKFSELRTILFTEAKTANFTVRDASIDFFKSFNSTRNAQDHIAHLPSSKIHKSDLELLKKNLTIFIKTVFDEHKKYCQII